MVSVDRDGHIFQSSQTAQITGLAVGIGLDIEIASSGQRAIQGFYQDSRFYLVIKHGNGELNWMFKNLNGKITSKWCIFHCHA